MRSTLSCAAMLALAGCAGVNPQMKAATDAQIAGAKAKHHEGAPENYDLKPWATGDWALFAARAAPEPRTYKWTVLQPEGAGFWIELDTQDYRHHDVQKFLFAKQPKSVTDESANL